MWYETSLVSRIGLAGLGVDPVDHLGEVLGDVDLGRVDVLGAEVVVGGDTERHAAVGAPEAELDPAALLVAVVKHRLEHAADHPLGLARVDALAHRLVGHVVLVLAVLAVEDLRGDRDRRGVVEHRDLERHHREVALGERHHAGGAQVHALAGRRPPQHVAGVHAGAEVQDPLVLEQVGHRQQQWLVVDVEPDELGVGGVDDRLPDPREPVRLLGVPDRPRLVEAVEERAVRVGLTALLDVRTHAEVAVADREDALGGAEVVVAEARLDQAPRIDREARAVEEVEDRRRLVRRPLLVEISGLRLHAARHQRGVSRAHKRSSRSVTTWLAPFSVRASAPTPRSTPTTSPKCPAFPAATPLSASSSTTARDGSTPSCCAA